MQFDMKIKKPNRRIKPERMTLGFGHFSNKRVALFATCDNGAPWGRLNVNIITEPFDDDEVVINEYFSGNDHPRGITNSLIEAEIVAPPHRYVTSGYGSFPVCRLLIKPPGDHHE